MFKLKYGLQQFLRKMNKNIFLILTVLFTLLFIILVTIGSYLLSIQNKQFAIAMFLFAFGSVFGQFICLAMYIKERTQIRKNN